MYPVRITIVSVFICVALMSSACNNTETAIPDARVESARPAKIVPVLSDGISVMRTFPGTLEATKKADLAFRVGGQLTKLPAQAGLAVEEGDLLARLDESDFQNTLKERQARYDLAKVKHDQIIKLKEKEFSSQLQFDQTSSELKSAHAALKQARDNLRYTQLVAPFDGVVARVDIENYQAVQAKAPIIQLQVDDL